jgi:hypothetical protein
MDCSAEARKEGEVAGNSPTRPQHKPHTHVVSWRETDWITGSKRREEWLPARIFRDVSSYAWRV